MKNKKNIIFIVVSMIFVISFLLLNKTNNVRQIKVKELNYNVTYKQAFPDENLRRGVVLCIMRDMCGEEQYNKSYISSFSFFDTRDDIIETKSYATQPKYGTILTESEIAAKEEERISKTDLDKLRVLIPYDQQKDINTLEGVEYLTNLKGVFLRNLKVEHVEFLYNKDLEKIYLNSEINSATDFYSKINTVNFRANTKVNTIVMKMGWYDKTVDLSYLPLLEYLVLQQSNIKEIKLPSNLKQLYIDNNYMSKLELPEGLKYVSVRYADLKNGIVLPNSVERANLVDSNISSIKFSNPSLPKNIINLQLWRNNISTIDLTKTNKLEELNLEQNPIEKIDVTDSVKLKILKIRDSKITSAIDFSHNTDLALLTIINKDKDHKIESFDLSNNPNLESLTLGNLNIHNLKLPDTLSKLNSLGLINNNFNKLDLSKYPMLDSVGLSNNNIKNLKIDNKSYSYFNVKEEKTFKVKKNLYTKLEDIFLNDNKLILEDNPNYEKVGDKYFLKTLGEFKIKAVRIEGSNNKFIGDYTFIVEAGEEDSFNPTIDQKDYTPVINEEIAVDKLKEMVTNLPTNIKNFEIISANTFSTKGDKKVKVRVTFSDDTFKEFDIDIKVYEEKYIEPTVKISSLDVELNEKKSLNINVTREYDKEESIDDVNLIKYLKDKPINYEYNNVPNGLTYDLNKISGVIDYNFLGNEKEKVFNITYKENGNSYSVNKTIKVKLIKEIIEKETPKAIAKTPSVASFKKANKRVRRSLATYNEVNETVQELETLITKTKNDNFENKETKEVENLKNNILVKIEKAKEKLKKSYTEETEEEKLQEVKEKVLKEIDNLKEELNKVRDRVLVDKTKLNEKIKELEKAIKNKQCSNNDCKEVLEKAKKIYNQTNLTKEEVNESINKITNLLEVKENNSKSFNYLYLLLLLPLIMFIFIILKKRKKENKKM